MLVAKVTSRAMARPGTVRAVVTASMAIRDFILIDILLG
jgi:hypothetical protein